MRITYDHDADAAYIDLGGHAPTADRTTTQASTPDGVDGFVALDWEGGRLVGIEILDASNKLREEILDQADAD